ncbi:hypothetical protein RFI_03473 [Reticulomyxa filosa]|uniref:Uncharacterized protein n=1 Tax=Reticulomyxa filosa TaxID=46433 RepID=X6P607_RETFI|nr:hypothetical protein RFI_03473 [Reticulomyxa filosa]|eukprot:ETO33631.1 hypothetical protein RFI_03473 [Reticulomyxa filosa]
MFASVICLGVWLVGLVLGLGLEIIGTESILRKTTGLPSKFGFVALVWIFNVFVLQWMGFRVNNNKNLYFEILQTCATTKFITLNVSDVFFFVVFKDNNTDPEAYANKQENKYAKEFNCFQRAHQNTLERMFL